MKAEKNNKKTEIRPVYNLIERYKQSGEEIEHETDWNKWIQNRFCTNENKELGIKKGDTVQFISGFHSDLEYITRILGFDEEGKAYLLWECYWFPVDLKKRKFKKV